MVLELARDALESSASFDSEADNISIFAEDESGGSELLDEFKIQGQFPAEGEEDAILPPSESVTVSAESDVGQEIQELFAEVQDSISVSPGEITSMQYTNLRKEAMDSWPFYTLEEADGRFFIGVCNTSVSREMQSKLRQSLADLMDDESVTRSQIIDAEFLFADRAICELSSVRGHIETAYPHEHYRNITSFSEYVEKRAESSDVFTEEELHSKGMHQIEFSLSTGGQGGLTEEACECAEGLLWEYITESLETEYEHMIEGEVIQFDGGTYARNDDLTKYYLYVPVTDGEIGVTR